MSALAPVMEPEILEKTTNKTQDEDITDHYHNNNSAEEEITFIAGPTEKKVFLTMDDVELQFVNKIASTKPDRSQSCGTDASAGYRIKALFEAAIIVAKESTEKAKNKIKRKPGLERSKVPNILRKKKVINTVTKFPEVANIKIKDGNMISVVTREGNLYTCLLCEREDTVCDNAKAIILHIWQAHNERLYICDVCGKDFRERKKCSMHLNKHVEIKNQRKILGCNTCGKKYRSEKVLADHINVHMGVRPYVCSTCGKMFASRYVLMKHHKIHITKPSLYPCRHCKKSFYAQQQLTEHERTHSNQLGSAHNLKVHSTIPASYKSFICDLCERVVIGEFKMLQHKRSHTNERPCLCEFCAATFKCQSNLRAHQRAIHCEPYKCNRCGIEFNGKRFLDQHIKLIHTSECLFKCSICEATCLNPQSLKKHERIHTAEKQFLCEFCGIPFDDRYSRNAHRFIHSDKKPFECVTCGAGFMQRMLVYRHMQSQGHLNDTIIINEAIPKTDDEQIITASADGGMEIVVAEDDGVEHNHLAKHMIIKEGEMFTDTKTLMNLPEEQIDKKTSHNLNSDKTQIIQDHDGTSTMCKKNEP